jgi:hypothetical protein
MPVLRRQRPAITIFDALTAEQTEIVGGRLVARRDREPALLLRDVSVEGGVLRFRVPASWRQSEDPAGGSLFHGVDDAQGPGLLRARVMTFTSEARLSPRVARAELEALAPEPDQRIETLKNGSALRTHRESVEAPEGTIRLHVWMLSSVEPPNRLHLAVFSYVLGGDRDHDPTARRTLAALDREIRDARFGYQMS